MTKVWIYVTRLDELKKYLLKADRVIFITEGKEFDRGMEYDVIVPESMQEYEYEDELPPTIQDVAVDLFGTEKKNFLEIFNEELGPHALIRCQLEIKD